MPPARTRNCASTFLLSSLLLLLSCQERTTQKAPGQKAAIFEEQDLDVLSLSVRHADLGGLVAIREEDYFSLVASGDFAAADATVREQQLSLAASANAASALGLVGTLEAGVSLNDKRVVVLHNSRKVGDDGRHQATSFSVVGGRLFGAVGWALVAPQLHFSELHDDDCARPYRGCAVLIPPDMRPHAFSNWEEGGMGLPPEYRLDAESAIGPQNRVGRTIEYWALPNPDVADLVWPKDEYAPVFVGNRFACANPLTEDAVAACEPEWTPSLKFVSSQTSTKLSPRVALVAEADFQAALLAGELQNHSAEPAMVELAATITTSLNHAESRGILGEYKEADALEADVLLVAMSVNVFEERVYADRVFVVPGPVGLPLGTGRVGINTSIVGLDESLFSMGVCGPVVFPSLELGESPPGLPQPLSLSQAGYGSDRQLAGLPRATLRFPVVHQGRQSIQVLACSHYEPPRPPPPPASPTFKYELCNGVDDTGDGNIDEGTCALSYCSSCEPVTDCGPRRCSSVPDGCGGILTCPCP